MSRLQTIIASVSTFSIIALGLILFAFTGQSKHEEFVYETTDIASEVSEPATDIESGITTVSFDELTHDFGKIKEGEIVSHIFSFTNTGMYPLKIEDVKPSCGCTTPKWSKEEVMPGESGFLEVEFNSAGKEGQQHKTIKVTLNTEEKMMTLSFEGEVVKE